MVQACTILLCDISHGSLANLGANQVTESHRSLVIKDSWAAFSIKENVMRNVIKQSAKLFLASSILFAGTSQAAQVVDLIGDIDNLGGNAGATSYTGSFDTRSPAELAATNGAQFTDNATASFGTSYSHGIFTHNYSAFSSITSAQWDLGLGGLQSFNDELRLDGTVIAAGSQLPDQGSNGYGIYSIMLTDFTSLLDGMAIFNLAMNVGGSGAEPVVFDFAKLTINGTLAATNGPNPVPIPAAAFMFAPALLGFMGLRRKAKNSVA